MGFLNWFRELFGGQAQPKERVPFYDVPSRRVIYIPPEELAPGAVRAKIQGIEGVVWILADQLQAGPLQHPPFDEDVRQHIRRIQETFAEHRPMSADEWEDGFRRDRDPIPEIALWIHASDIFRDFTKDEPLADRRKNVYQVIVACLTSTPDMVRRVLPQGSLSGEEIDRIVARFFPKRSSASLKPSSCAVLVPTSGPNRAFLSLIRPKTKTA
ncbi:MAG TPA: hypothetical protein VEA41_04390 [Salinarimonas sp.]|nr:hypothetical protein [Salinarimonas sp.]